MDAKEREQFYDARVAPELLRLAKLCQDNGLSFVAGVEWVPGLWGRTACLTADASVDMRQANKALSDGTPTVAITVTKP